MHQRRIFHIDGTSPIDHQTKNQFILCLRAQNNTSAHPFSHLKREDSSNSQFNFKIVCVSAKTLHILTVHRVYIYFARTIRYLKSILQNCSLLRAERTTKLKLSSEAPKSTTSQITIETHRIGKLREFEQRKTIPFSDH